MQIKLPGRAAIHYPSRLIELDILRAAAIFLVLGRHMDSQGSETGGLIGQLLTGWQRGGWVGVDLFFVLSGFLVSGLLFREYIERGEVDVLRFLVRRGFKIYPPFYFLMAVTGAILLIGGMQQGRAFFCELVFFQNYCGGLWNHTWSLAIEEHFYLLLAVTVGAVTYRSVSRKPISRLPWMVLAVIVACNLLRLIQSTTPFTYLTHLYPTHLRIDSLAIGVLIAYYYHFSRERFTKFAQTYSKYLFFLGMALLAPVFKFDLETHGLIYTFGLTVFALASGMLLTAVLVKKAPRNLLTYTLGYIGLQSYSIYLWHSSVQSWWMPLLRSQMALNLPDQIYTWIYVIASLALGIVMGIVIEKPFLWLRDTRFPSRQPVQ